MHRNLQWLGVLQCFAGCLSNVLRLRYMEKILKYVVLQITYAYKVKLSNGAAYFFLKWLTLTVIVCLLVEYKRIIPVPNMALLFMPD